MYTRNAPDADRTAPAARARATRALVCAAIALVSLPVLVFVPLGGFVSAAVGVVGIVAGWRGLHETVPGDPGRGATATGFVVALVVTAVCIVAAVFWTVMVVDPAITQNSDLRRLVDGLLS
ncbi:hypothetical protein HQ305_16475 [Rhodococcus sp. BP-149]|uniref:hypothetical protein n=1 Tax=unclassified Rhodococcus (in: high G+C Gram-positive bacteria) TaxID=192944 RepID=UPI001C9A5846|nr:MULTISPECIES: hypothetical protein [unclassified Rhodococcus (in: high G+C Gram-positive bacteria)]MBY6687155.1 hypothetical protein [Rhodococcus sp. BP-288]MBY6694422.1 hypothetical protein [Rhodococcus sp. BP-188]MBY6698131.1 hypothetical protein [Rhodococcus sp. BP-285]MBY6704351.1 hypothetical protein [Rhodococcus sp. BP-283]MBY6713000.1 hypothetical protein [Rhodococcus sp. BP-160]